MEGHDQDSAKIGRGKHLDHAISLSSFLYEQARDPESTINTIDYNFTYRHGDYLRQFMYAQKAPVPISPWKSGTDPLAVGGRFDPTSAYEYTAAEYNGSDQENWY